MNELIKELVAQTYMFDNYEMVGGEQTKVYSFTSAGITSLVELLIEECISEMSDAFAMTLEEGNHLKEHFGVKE